MDTTNRDWQHRIEAKLDKIHVLLMGDGNPHKGMVVRLDRLEQRARRSVVVQSVVVTSIVAAIVAAVMAWIIR